MRLFIAFCLSEEIKDSLCDAIASLRAASGRGRYTLRDNLHLTLVFIGETDRVEDIVEVMEEVAEDSFTGPIELTLTAPGIFRGRGGDLHWVGVENTHALGRLAKELAAGLAAAGFDIEKRRYTPHITIAREVVFAPLIVDYERGASNRQSFDAKTQGRNRNRDRDRDRMSGREVPAANVLIRRASMAASHMSLMRSDRVHGRQIYTEIATVMCGYKCNNAEDFQ